MSQTDQIVETKLTVEQPISQAPEKVVASSACCTPVAQQTCCEPSQKTACCGASLATNSCGCK